MPENNFQDNIPIIDIKSDRAEEIYEVNCQERVLRNKTIGFKLSLKREKEIDVKTLLLSIDWYNIQRVITNLSNPSHQQEGLLYEKKEGETYRELEECLKGYKKSRNYVTEMLKEIKGKIIIQERIGWDRRELDGLVIYRRRIAYMVLSDDSTVYHKKEIL